MGIFEEHCKIPSTRAPCSIFIFTNNPFRLGFIFEFLISSEKRKTNPGYSSNLRSQPDYRPKETTDIRSGLNPKISWNVITNHTSDAIRKPNDRHRVFSLYQVFRQTLDIKCFTEDPGLKTSF